MIRLKRIPVLLLIMVLAGLLQTCQKEQYSHQYVNLTRLFPYLARAFEAKTLKFIKKDMQWSKYILKGFRTYGDQLPRTWAVEKESTIITYFSELEDKTAVFKCRPFNPPGQPLQEAEIFINGNFLRKIILPKKGEYHFTIPANLLNYGSNHLTFKWKYIRSPHDFGINKDKRKFVVGFSYLTFQGKSLKEKQRKKLSKIHLQPTKNKIPAIHIPRGGMIEYFVHIPPLPLKSQLRFGLSSQQKHLDDSIFHLAVYGEKGEKTTGHFNPRQFPSSNQHQFNLDSFANQTVKIVFANSIRNHPNFTVNVINPTIYTSAAEGLPLFSLEMKPAEKQKSKIHPSIGKKPNVFIYLIDTLRADHVSCYGYSRETTPFIDQFSKQGILFKNCFAAASWTKPAVGSVLTGLYPNKHRGEDKKDKLSTEVETLAEVLKARGYTTIHITPNVNTSKEVNFDQGVDHYMFSRGGKDLEYFYHSSQYLNSEFFEIIQRNPDLLKKPLFAFLHTVDPHDPYTPEEPFLKFKKADKERENLGLPDNIRIKKATTGLSREDIDYIKSLYDCEILHNDYYFGKWLEFLKEKNLYENSIIVVVADHGEQFAEHRGLFHGSSIYNEEIHVPLIIKFPGGEFSGKQTDVMVSQVDIFPTILDYLGIEIPAMVDGISIFNILSNRQFQRSLFVKEELNRDEKHKNNFLGMINTGNKIKHIINYKNEFFIKALDIESYDLRGDFVESKDIFEKGNIFRFKAIKFSADYFLEKMESFGFKEAEKLDLNKLDPEKIKQLRALGYIN